MVEEHALADEAKVLLEPVTEPQPQTVPAPKYFWWFALIVVTTVAIDQISKAWLRGALAMGDEISLVPGWVHLSHVLNYGAAWGMLSGQRPLLIVVAIFVIAAVGFMLSQMEAHDKLARIALGLILGGALGNLIDRVLFGAVTDMIDLDTPWQPLREFPVFNIADSALTVGVILLMLDFLRRHRHTS